MVIFPAFPAKGRVVNVVKETVVTAVVACAAFLSAAAKVIDTSETVPIDGTVAPALTASVAVLTVKPVAVPAVTPAAVTLELLVSPY